MSTIQQRGATRTNGPAAGPPSSPGTGTVPQRSLPLLKVLLIVGVVFITIIGASLFVFAQSAAPANMTPSSASNGRQTNRGGKTPSVPAPHTTTATGSRPPATANPTAQPAQPSQLSNQGQGTPVAGLASASDVPSTQMLSQLGWTQAGLSLGDAVEVLRTGATFTDREMSYDYRNIGTPTNHSGTLTGATFLLTPGGNVRFLQNDVRAINNVLYNKVSAGKIIQQVVNAQPALVQFQNVLIQGQERQIAWVNVAFELFVSQIDPASGTRTAMLAHDATTGQPVLHHLAVVLLRVPVQNQGANAPMGGTGWLVNTYALDAPTLPMLATDPSL